MGFGGFWVGWGWAGGIITNMSLSPLLNLHLQLDATLLNLHLQLDATLLKLHLQLDATLLKLHLQLDATLLKLHLQLDATLLKLHLQLDATLLKLHLQLDATLLKLHFQLDATLLNLHLQLDATLLKLHLQLDATLLNLHLQLDATLLKLHLQLDAALLKLHLQLDATLLNLHLQHCRDSDDPVYPNASDISGTQMLDRSWQNLKTFLGFHLCLKHKERGCSRMPPHVAQNVYMWVWRQSLGPVNPRHFCSNWRSYCDLQKWKKRPDKLISCVKSSSAKNRHLAEAKHDFSAFLLVNRPAIANMIMAMCNAL